MEYNVQQMFQQNTRHYISMRRKHIFSNIVRHCCYLKYRLNLEMKLGINLQKNIIHINSDCWLELDECDPMIQL